MNVLFRWSLDLRNTSKRFAKGLCTSSNRHSQFQPPPTGGGGGGGVGFTTHRVQSIPGDIIPAGPPNKNVIFLIKKSLKYRRPNDILFLFCYIFKSLINPVLESWIYTKILRICVLYKNVDFFRCVYIIFAPKFKFQWRYFVRIGITRFAWIIYNGRCMQTGNVDPLSQRIWDMRFCQRKNNAWLHSTS